MTLNEGRYQWSVPIEFEIILHQVRVWADDKLRRCGWWDPMKGNAVIELESSIRRGNSRVGIT
jgi:hypothetical protein